MNLSEFDQDIQRIVEGLLSAYPIFAQYIQIKKSNIDKRHYISIEVPPGSEFGQESLFIKIKGESLNLGYDYCNIYFKLCDEIIEELINKIRDIFEENIVAMSTRSDSGIVATPLFKEPSKAKASEKSWNFRIRSWKGTYDSGE